jgi:hypothetical protein
MRILALLLFASVLAAMLTGCGGTSRLNASSPAAQRLQREDLLAVSRALRQAAGSAQREMAAARIAWPLIAEGLPTPIPPAIRPAVLTASRMARAIVVPAPVSRTQARLLTGPAAGIAGEFAAFNRLTERGWTLTSAAAGEITSGPPAAAAFARENVALYIDSIYDGHFDAALIGKSLLAGYRLLGGEKAFGRTLSQAEVDALASAYSPATERLYPHPKVKLAS